jgi:hypothetical protein
VAVNYKISPHLTMGRGPRAGMPRRGEPLGAVLAASGFAQELNR